MILTVLVEISKVESPPDRTSFEIELRRNCRGKLHTVTVQKGEKERLSLAVKFKIERQKETSEKWREWTGIIF